MSWEDPRGGGMKVAASGARMIAHHEQAKSRRDESQGLRTHGSARRWLVGAGAAVTVVAVIVAVTLAARGDPGAPAAAAPAARSSQAAAAKSVEPSADAAPAAVVLTAADTEPRGPYAVRTTTREKQRNGKLKPVSHTKYTWTFKPGSCVSDSCKGKAVSSSGARYTWVWDGRALTMKRPPLTTDRAACVDDNGNTVPISDASFIATYTYTMGAITAVATDGPVESMKGVYSYTIDYQNFGSCQDTPLDTVSASIRFTATGTQ